MAIDHKLNDSKRKNIAHRLKNKGLAYITSLMLLTGCGGEKYKIAYESDYYELHLNHEGTRGKIVEYENPHFFGRDILGKKKIYIFKVDNGDSLRIREIRPEDMTLIEYTDYRGLLSKERSFNDASHAIDREKLEGKQEYLKLEWSKFQEVAIRQLRRE